MKTSILQQNEIPFSVVELVQRMVARIPWPDRRQAMADVTMTLLEGKPRVAEAVFGWGRATVELGMHELQSGIVCLNDLSNRRKPKTEEKYPQLVEELRAITEADSQAQSHLRTDFTYTNMTATSVRSALLEKGWPKETIPTVRTLSNILNRQNYKLRRVTKTQVEKKTEYTDPIFANVKRVNAKADADQEAIRISLDTKATINVGPYSRGGRSRGLKAVDHDMMPKEKLVPGGILEPASGKAFLFFTSSNKTSDFVADGIDLWWTLSKERLVAVKRIIINLDNGPECSGHRSQFLKRMVAFADRENKEVRLIYYPPYHSKYNAIERYWGGLERSWNGYLLDCVETILGRAGRFIWRRAKATITLMNRLYEKGVTLNGKNKKELELRLHRLEDLPWWDITIYPLTVY